MRIPSASIIFRLYFTRSDHSERNIAGQISGHSIDQVNVECDSKLQAIQQGQGDFHLSKQFDQQFDQQSDILTNSLITKVTFLTNSLISEVTF